MNTHNWSPDTLRAIHEAKVRRMTPAQRSRTQQAYDDIVRFWDTFPVVRVHEPQGHDPYNHIGRLVRQAKGWPPPVMCAVDVAPGRDHTVMWWG